jgi:mono/diheme cytochrome c family protein
MRGRVWRNARWQGAVTVAVGAAWLACGGGPTTARAQGGAQFNRDIRPILSDNCFPCHGPDAAKRKADLRLDVEESAKRDVDGTRPIVPGKLDASRLYARITSTQADEQMPPPESGKKLSGAQIEAIAQWIRAGAPWEKHWSLIPPARPVPPRVRAADWVRNPIDAFILARLEAEGLAPSAEADKTTLARRVTLDLTGLPPTLAEVDDFLADDSPEAYERLVDRLLRSPRYGERMAARWLDAARYADTSGYQTDGVRTMWRWRDWVIEAFNRNLPFDRFTIEQLAGDLLSGATLEQRIATGFNRNHRGNAEGGIIPEEYAAEYVVDRVDTTATVWLGLTVACARCHDHKFDPITQQEFYQFFAFFNNVPEKGRAIKVGNSPPLIKAPTRLQHEQWQALDGERIAAEDAFAQLQGELAAGESRWAANFAPGGPIDWAPGEALLAHFPLDDPAASAPEKAAVARLALEGPITFAPGAVGRAASFDGASSANAGDVANFGYFDPFTLAAWIRPHADNGIVLARMSGETDAEGYSLQLAGGKLQVNLVKRWLDDALRVETDEPLASDRWQHVAVTYDGSRVAGGLKIFVDGRPQTIRILLDELNQSFNTAEPLRIGGGGSGPAFDGLIDDVRIYKTDLSAADVSLLATRESIDAIAALRPRDRTAPQSAKLRAYYLERHAPAPIRAARARMVELRQRMREFEESFPTTMVMDELPTPRETFVLVRGQYDKPGGRVTADVPAHLNPLPSPAARNRLALARWLVDPANPLTARVAVNRFWQSYFGAGLVKTVDDFGSQGDAPSHVELLDWLATEFVAGGWDMKGLQKKIVTSATYRQSSKVASQQVERDPDNRLLARGPRFRLPAEVIRDSSLAASGLLVEELGGPSVHPYQPPGLWKELTGGGDVAQDHGANLYRRSLYTFWKRTIQPPSMMTFDASGREACSVRMARTNTPLQALALLNEITFVEAARVLAQRAMSQGGATPRERITLAFRLAVARRPSERELKILLGGFERQWADFRRRPPAAEGLLRVGEAPLDARLDPCELAAYTTVASLILNLDEMVTKE